jgi:hypothetical protein
MGWNSKNSDRIASKDYRSVDFGISDVEIQSVLLRFSFDPSKWDILHFKIKNLANTHAETLVLYSVHTICQVFHCTKMYYFRLHLSVCQTITSYLASFQAE